MADRDLPAGGGARPAGAGERGCPPYTHRAPGGRPLPRDLPYEDIAERGAPGHGDRGRAPGEIAASLGKGFASQGWEPIDSGAEGPVAWGRYRLEREGELWELVFTLVAMPLRPNTYTLCVVAERLR